MRTDIRSACIAIVVMTIVLGLLYPLAITGIGQVAFPNAADGSTVKVDGTVVGSKLIGQDFSTGKDAKRWFQSRPSVTGYAPNATFFNNRGPNQATLAVQQRRFVLDYLRRERPYDPGLKASGVPADAATTSASGVDPQISLANARIQAARVAKVRGIPIDRVRALIHQNTDGRFAGVLGDPGVNVLELNLALDAETGR
jgi:potassium-transporting ATPase KdpC subunit